MFGIKKTTILFFLIIILAVFLRLYKLGSVPSGFFIDESSEGYSAYSILKTGKDEFGKALPIVFRSLGDFKTPVYIYSIIPFISLMDLTPMAIRFPSFLFGLLTIPIVYLLCKELFDQKFKNKDNLSLLVAFLLAISPWHILFSRTASESNLALFIFLTAILLFFKGLKKPLFIFFSLLLFALATSAYHAQRILSPITLLLLLIKYKGIVFKQSHFMHLTIGLIFSFIILLPTISIANTPGFLQRFQKVSITNEEYIETNNNTNEKLNTTKVFLSNYVSYVSPITMFVTGDPDPGNSFPNLPTFHPWQMIFYFFGFWFLIRLKKFDKLKFFIFVTFFTSPIPAALARDHYSSVRSLPILIPQIIIIALGIYYFFLQIKNRRILIFFQIILLIIFISSVVKVYNSVFIEHNSQRAEYWDYGWQKLSMEITKLDKNIPVVVDTDRDFDHYHLLFFLKHEPLTYHAENFEVLPNEYYINLERKYNKKILNIEVRNFDWEKDVSINQYLVGTDNTLSLDNISKHNLEIISEIYYPNSKIAFRIVKTK